MVNSAKKTAYIPERGDIVWLNFNPTRGHEQNGKRPALVLSPKAYNTKTGLMIVCPITSQTKKYPFEVEVNSAKVSGFVLSDQVKSIDWKERKATFITKVNSSVLSIVLHNIQLLLEL